MLNREMDLLNVIDAIVPDQKGFARLQSSIEMDDGNALPLRSRDDAIAGLKNETAELCHGSILHARHVFWLTMAHPGSKCRTQGLQV